MNTSDVIVFDVVNELWEQYKKVAARGRILASTTGNGEMENGLPFADATDEEGEEKVAHES